MSLMIMNSVSTLGDWKRAAFQLIEKGAWEDAIILWEKNVPVNTFCLWLAVILSSSENLIDAQLGRMIIDWYNTPQDTLRWEIFKQAEKVGFDTPSGALGLAVFWLEGSISPEGLEPVYPDPMLSGKMLHASLLAFVCIYSETPSVGTRSLLTQWSDEV